MDLCDVQRDIVIRVVKCRWVLRSTLDQDLPLVYLLVLLLLLTGCFFHGVQCDSSQGTFLVPMHFKLGLLLAIDASSLQSIVAAGVLIVHSFTAGDTTEVRVSQAAGAGWTLVGVPGDHLVDQIEGQLAGGRYRILQLLEGHLAIRLGEAAWQVCHTDSAGDIVARFPRAWHAAYQPR